MGIAREDERIVWDEQIPLNQGESAVCLSSDPISKTFWICTNQNVLEVLVRDEERDVWRGKLEKAEYTDALYFAKVRRSFESKLITRPNYKRILSFLGKQIGCLTMGAIYRPLRRMPNHRGALNL